MSRAWTQKEVQEKFLEHCWHMVEYWDKQSRETSTRGKLEGLLHSILAMLDGCAAEVPAYEVIPRPHLLDKQYRIDHGENFYEPFELPFAAVTVHGSDSLHELMFDIGRKLGLHK